MEYRNYKKRLGKNKMSSNGLHRLRNGQDLAQLFGHLAVFGSNFLPPNRQDMHKHCVSPLVTVIRLIPIQIQTQPLYISILHLSFLLLDGRCQLRPPLPPSLSLPLLVVMWVALGKCITNNNTHKYNWIRLALEASFLLFKKKKKKQLLSKCNHLF